MLSNYGIAANKLSEAPLDLRAPIFSRVRRGGWWLRIITLLAVDSIVLITSWFLIQYRTSWNGQNDTLSLIATISIQLGALAIQGTYKPGRRRSDYLNLVKTLTFAHGLILMWCILFNPIEDITRSTIVSFWLLTTTLVCTGRLALDVSLSYLRDKKILGQNRIFVICAPNENEQIINFIKKENRYELSGFANITSLDRDNRGETLEKLNKLGITEVFISWEAIENRMYLCWLFQASGITVHILPMELKPIYRDIVVHNVGGMTCLSFVCPIITGRDFWVKRYFDLCFTTLFLLITFPVYIAISIAIKLDSPGPIFYRQTRIGLSGQEFQVWKFRTMRSDADKMQKELEALNETKDGILFKIKDDPRITKIGKFLRRYSLDELPQFFNVLVGEMTLVGPRPLPSRDVDKFSERHFIRQEVLPGITGLWQISGRSNILDFDQVMKLDLNYIENWSLWLDFEILFKTVQVVLNKEGAY